MVRMALLHFVMLIVLSISMAEADSDCCTGKTIKDSNGFCVSAITSAESLREIERIQQHFKAKLEKCATSEPCLECDCLKKTKDGSKASVGLVTEVNTSCPACPACEEFSEGKGLSLKHVTGFIAGVICTLVVIILAVLVINISSLKKLYARCLVKGGDRRDSRRDDVEQHLNEDPSQEDDSIEPGSSSPAIVSPMCDRSRETPAASLMSLRNEEKFVGEQSGSDVFVDVIRDHPHEDGKDVERATVTPHLPTVPKRH